MTSAGSEAELVEFGYPVQRRGVRSTPGLYFVGMHWMHKRKSASFAGVAGDAEYAAVHIAVGA